MARSKKVAEEGPFTNIGAAKALKGRWGDGSQNKARARADWHQVDPIIVHTLVACVGELGGAVTLGVDKNGTGYTVAVWLSGEKVYNQWFSGEAEGVEALHVQLQDFTDDVKALIRQPQ